ncbi:hypothetical protein SBOR_7623 [Sclerotinia borealis F-4128]|uniref:Uncharacterized protein n=1 Tax=Sclerotinia borealis (strain F-4128) TaxID=1432307 RepID=W9C5G1_SCLBF|nr:hypothetical protein SBOR_7623 [Sclerotinia borealis F-4128]
MFVSLTRQTAKLQQPYVCTSCLSKLLGASDALPLYSNAILSRAPRNAVTFSTTRRNHETKDGSASDGNGQTRENVPAHINENQHTETVAKKLKKLKAEPSTKDKNGDNQKVDNASGGSDGTGKGEESALTSFIGAVNAASKQSNSTKKKPKKNKTAKQLKREEINEQRAASEEKNQETKTKKKNAKKASKSKETESDVRIKKVKQKLINYVNSAMPETDSYSKGLNPDTASPVADNQGRKKIAPSQLHSIYEAMVIEKGQAAARLSLVELIQKGGLTTTDRTQVMKELRASLVNRARPKDAPTPEMATPSSNLAGMLASFESIRKSPVRNVVDKRSKSTDKSENSRNKAASAKNSKGIKTGPMVKSPGTVDFDVQSVCANSLQLVPVQKKQPPVPGLSYGLDRALFNPGVYNLQDPRSRVFNFDPYLQQIMPVSEFDFTALKQYVTSSRDKALIETAKDEKRKYTGSTSSMSASLAHFHFLLSQWRPINTSMLSQKFPVEFNSFTALQRGPSAVFLRERDGVYAIDADKQFDTANILSMLGKSMEKLLTLPKEEFEQYRKENSNSITEDQRNENESFHYTTMGDFLMRSQLDAHDPRLPGTGMFDLKTRAVISIRMDIENYAEGSGYEIFTRQGEFESFEREFFDMIRAAFLKYSLQVRMGRMDGIFVAYHNVERIFGFQYISLPELDDTIHGTTNTTLGDSEFKLSVDLLNKALDRATARFPGKSLRIHFETRGNGDTPFMYIFAEPMEEEDIQKIQDTNKAEIEAFEARVLGLHGDKATEEDQLEEKKNAEWEDLRAKVEESMESDEYEIKSAKEIAESLLEHHDVTGLTLDEVEQRVEEFLSTSSYNEHNDEDSAREHENKSWKEEQNVDADEEGDEITEEDEDIEHDEDVELTTAEVDEDADQENDEDGEEEEEYEEDDEEETEERDTENEVEDTDNEAKTSDLIEIATENTVIQEGLLVDAAEETSETQQNNDESLEAVTREPELVENEGLLIDSAKETSDVDDTNDESLHSEESVTAESLPSEESVTAESEILEETDDINDETLIKDDEFILPEQDNPKEILAMHLAIRNKVNGQYTVRPENLTEDDNWTVEYALSEIPRQERAMNLYKACQTRRKTALRKTDEPAGNNKWAEERNNKFIQQLKNLAKKGRQWRTEMTEKEASMPVKTLHYKEEPKEVGVYESFEEMKNEAGNAEEKPEMSKAIEETSEEKRE